MYSRCRHGAPQLTSKESHRKRDSQVNRRELLRTRNPTLPGETPSGSAAAMGCPRSVQPPLEPRNSQLFNTKNEEARTGERQNVDEKVVDVFFAIVCCSIGRHLSSILRRLDFPYKKKTKNSVQNIKNPNLTQTGIFGNFLDQLGLTDWFISVPPSELCQFSVSFCNFPDQLGLTDWFASVLPSQHCQLSGKFSDQLGLTDQINTVGPK